MESSGRELDETATDAAIADLLSCEDSAEVETAPEMKSTARALFPDLAPQDVTDDQDNHQPGLGAILRQKWTELSGAA